MTDNQKSILLQLLARHKRLGIADQIDFAKFYLYSLVAHSTAIEGSTVTEVEAQLLFDEGITSGKRTMMEQLMNLDLKAAYDYGMQWIRRHEPITVEWLITLAAKVMARTGSEYSALGGDFSAAGGELRKLNVAQSESKESALSLPSQSNDGGANVSAGVGGKSYMSYLKVPDHLAAFCHELNRRRQSVEPADPCAIYDMSFCAHYQLVTIHPWADGNGRTSRLLMNLLQTEFGVLPSKVLREDKAAYIQSLVDAREQEDPDIFVGCMASLHIHHLQSDIDQFLQSI